MAFWERIKGGGSGGRGLTASVTVHDGPSVRLGSIHTKRWQHTAWDYWGQLGELHYPTSQIARLVSRLDWTVTVDGKQLERAIEGDDVVDQILARVTFPMDVSEAVRLLALNFQVAGELWYIYQGGDSGWLATSIVDPALRQLRDNENFIKLRAYIQDPRDYRFADSPMSAILGPSEELLTLESLSRSQTRSRLSQAGILLRPTEVEFPETDENGNPRPSFGEDLERAMTAPINDETSPSALVPMDVEVPGEQVTNFRHLTFQRPYDERLHERIERAISRIAVGLDIPAELLLGIADMNHWNAWLVQEETYKGHAEPLAYRVGEVLAEAAEAIGLAQTVDIVPDPSALLAKRSTVRDAFEGAKLGAVGLPFVRDAIGANEEDAPSEQDLQIMRDRDRPRRPEGQGEGEGGEQRPGPPSEDNRPDRAVVAQGATDEAEETVDLERMGFELMRLDQQLRERLLGAMQQAASSAMRRLGAKVRTAVRNSSEHAAIVDVANRRVPSAMGVRTFDHVDVEGTLRDEFIDIGEWWRDEANRAREQLAEIAGVDTSGGAWDDAIDRSVGELIDELVAWVQADISREELAPSGEVTLTELAREVVAIAGGS